MGIFYSAGRDPIFYSHHANVDRMWEVWKSLQGRKKRDLEDPDWLGATFLFYDENKDLVRAKVRDCLDTRKLGYVYEDVKLEWLNSKPEGSTSKLLKKRRRMQKFGGVNEKVEFPVVLSSPVTSVVERGKKGRSKKEKEMTEEVLVVEGIQYSVKSPVKFDVYVHREGEFSGPQGATSREYAGSFVTVRHLNKKGTMKTNMRLGISQLLEDLGADDDQRVGVTLVPEAGDGPVTIQGIRIEYVDV